MFMTRRSFLMGSLLSGGAVLAANATGRLYSLPQLNELYIPELIDARSRHQSIALEVQEGSRHFFPGRESITLGYNGSYLGPTLRVHQGDDSEVTITNTLGEDTTVHWHGLLVSGNLDGGPHQTIPAGATWRPVLPIRQRACTLWYHSHAHGRTARQVYAGLAGMLIVSDDHEKSLGLPSDYGVDDIPLILQDKQFEQGTLVLPQGMMTTMHGRRGDTLLVNGTVNPVAKVPPRLVRLRMVNGANARFFDLAFSDARIFHWIASEGGLLEKPVALRSLRLVPGERAEILVDFSNGRPATLTTGPDSSLSMMRMMTPMSGASETTVIEFIPQGSGSSSLQVPQRLHAPEPRIPSTALRRRRFELTMGMEMGMGMGMGMGNMRRDETRMSRASFGINDRAFSMDRVDERVNLDDSEIWEVTGAMMAHPFHVHGVHFQVISRNGSAPQTRDKGMKDTVLVREPVELLVHFNQPSLGAPFMYHCHILEHEDNGMMGQFTVT